MPPVTPMTICMELLLFLRVALVGEQTAVDLFDGDFQGLHVLGIHQRLSAVHQLAGALAGLHHKRITGIHFFRQFRKETGMTPGQFRNQIGPIF